MKMKVKMKILLLLSSVLIHASCAVPYFYWKGYSPEIAMFPDFSLSGPGALGAGLVLLPSILAFGAVTLPTTFLSLPFQYPFINSGTSTAKYPRTTRLAHQEYIKNQHYDKVVETVPDSFEPPNKKEHSYKLLISATESNNIGMIKDLVNLGANVNEYDNQRRTPLHIATQNNQADIVKLLLEHGANVNALDKQTRTPTIIAAEKGNNKIIEMLIAAGAQYLNIALLAAVVHHHEETALLLISENADVNYVDGNKNIPLIYAMNSKNLKLIKALIDAGANIHFKDIYQRTPLMLAAELSNAEAVDLLINVGANINERDTENQTPLMYATLASKKINDFDMQLETISILIKSGADINAQDNNKHTALFYALESRQYTVAKLLKENGAK